MAAKKYIVEVRVIDAPSGDLDDWKNVYSVTDEVDSEAIISGFGKIGIHVAGAVKSYENAGTKAGTLPTP